MLFSIVLKNYGKNLFNKPVVNRHNSNEDKAMSNAARISSRSIWSFLGLVIIGIGFYYHSVCLMIPSFRKVFGINTLNLAPVDVFLVFLPVVSYLLLGLAVCLTFSIFKKINWPPRTGLLTELWDSISYGFSASIFIGFFMGVAGWAGIIAASYTWGIFIGSYVGMHLGLFCGLTIGVICGCKEELA